MTTYRKLTRWMFRWSGHCLGIPAAALFLYDLLSLLSQLADPYGSAYLSYDMLLQRALWEWAFLFAFALCVVLLSTRNASLVEKDGAMPVYGMMSLPAPRWALPAAQMSAAALCILALFAVQALSAAALYPLYLHHAAGAAQNYAQYAATLPGAAASLVSSIPSPTWANGLYLAFVRAPLLRLAVPATLLDFTAALGMVVLAAGVSVSGSVRPKGARVLLVFSTFCCAALMPNYFNSSRNGIDDLWELLWISAFPLVLGIALLVSAIRDRTYTNNLP